MRHPLSIALIALSTLAASADYPIDYEAQVEANAGSGDFAPYYIASNHHGVITQPQGVHARAKAWRPMSLDTRFSYGFGADIIGGYASATDYAKFHVADDSWSTHAMRPSAAWLQQLYGEVKYRGVFVTVGLKEYESDFVDPSLSSGDLTFSGNTRPMPGARAGFVDFQDIPFTDGWVQVHGVVSFNKATDNAWTRDHFNFYAGRINQGWWYSYKHCYFRTKPSERFSVTLGLQAGTQFDGDVAYYVDGKQTMYKRRKVGFRSFIDAMIPRVGEEYVVGNHVGSWDFKARYRLSNGDEIAGYFQWPWEDGSGIGKLNGYDGMWGVEYHRRGGGIVSGAVIEYLDFTNQSGPIHWDPVDSPGTTLTSQATGFDNYYNNYYNNGYSLYGMSIGSPFLPSPLYNLNGRNEFVCNRLRGFHVGVMGDISPRVSYKLLASYRKGWGTGLNPFVTPREDTSGLIQCVYRVKGVDGLSLKGEVAMDCGRLYGDNFGALVSLSYRATLNCLKK